MIGIDLFSGAGGMSLGAVQSGIEVVCAVERASNRIVIKYDFKINTNENRFSKLLDFVFNRIVKIDYERQYAKFYTDLLLPFKRLEVTMDFWENNNWLEKATISFVLTDQPKDISREDIIKQLPHKPFSIINELKDKYPKLFKHQHNKFYLFISRFFNKTVNSF